MRTQTWHVAIQVKDSGPYSLTIVRSHYLQGGRQMPRMVAGWDILPNETLQPHMDQAADLIQHALYQEDPASEPLPF